MNVLNKDDLDMNKYFEPESGGGARGFISNLSKKEYWGLVVACLIGPFILATGATYGLRNYRYYKIKKHTAKISYEYLLRLSTLQPTYAQSLLQPPASKDSGIDINKPFQHTINIPFNKTTNTNENWKNDDIKQITDIRTRINKLNEKELRFFSIIYTNWAHNPYYNECIYRTIEWVMTDKIIPEKVRMALYPPTAILNRTDRLTYYHAACISELRHGIMHELEPDTLSLIKMRTLIEEFSMFKMLKLEEFKARKSPDNTATVK